MSLATSFQADVNLFLTDIGRDMTLQRRVPGTYDVTTGITSSDTNTDYPGKGRLGDYSDFDKNNTTILDSDRKATFLPTDISAVPQPGDRLTVGSDVYTVITVKTREIGGTVISYTLQVRK